MNLKLFVPRTLVLDLIVLDKCEELLFPRFFDCPSQDVGAFVTDQLLGVLVPCQYLGHLFLIKKGAFFSRKRFGTFVSNQLEGAFIQTFWGIFS